MQMTWSLYHIYDEIYELIKHSCLSVSPDVKKLLKRTLGREKTDSAKEMVKTMLDNVARAEEKQKPVCQSPGYPTVYISFGDSLYLNYIKESCGRALIEATGNGYLRPSMVHPLTRENSGDNSGAGVPNIELEYIPEQEYMEVVVSFKGCGAELGNAMKIMTTAMLGKNYEGFKKLVLETVLAAGGKPCPPYGIGIGIGGQMDVACKLSRRAISTRDWRDTNDDPMLRDFEEELYEKINGLKIGPAGIGGETSCLAVKIGMTATHTAILPVAINFHCWVVRRRGIRFYKDGRRELLFAEERR